MNRWPSDKAYFWEQAPFFRLLLPLAFGIVCYDSGALSLLTGTIAAGIAVTSSLLLLLVGISGRRSAPVLSFLLTMCVLFSCGYALSWYGDVRHDARLPGNMGRVGGNCLAVIDDAPMEKDNSWKVPVHIIAADRNGQIVRACGRAFVYRAKDGEPMSLGKGDTVLLPGNWQPITNAGNPFEFDYAAFCRRENICYRQFVNARQMRLYGKGDAAGQTITDRAHDWCMQQLAAYLPDHEARGLIQAMLLGDEVNLDEDLRRSYSETGIVHIIAISGGNVSIFFLFISVLLWWIKNKRNAWIKYAIALPLVWFYVLMAGAGPSAIRAAVMFSLLAMAVILQKNNNSLNTLFATAFVLLCAQPMWLYSAGFQLSFAAVLSLVLFYGPVYHLVTMPGVLLRALWQVVAASIAAEVLVAPLVVHYFHLFPLLFIPANVAAYIFMGLVLLMGILVIASSALPGVAAFVGICTTRVVHWFDAIVAWMRLADPQAMRMLVLSGFELAVVYVVIAGFAVFLMKKRKAGLFIALGAVCMLIASFCADHWQVRHRECVVVYNISGANRVEYISGNTCHIICADTGRKAGYATTPAYINWRIRSIDTIRPSRPLHIHDKTVLVLTDTLSAAGQHIDELVLAGSGQMWPDRLQQLYSPREVVVGNGYNAAQRAVMVQQLKARGIAVHSVAEDGACIIE
jgi:competence protein ComEC